MRTGVAPRLAVAAVTLLFVTLAVFLLVNSLPGDAIEDDSTRPLPPGYIVALREQFHLDEPLGRRYVRWLGDVSRGQLGISMVEQRPVAAILRERLPVSISLNFAALCLTLALAVPLGILGAWRPGGTWDRASLAAATGLYAVPVFWMALLLQWLFAVRLGWVPLFGTSTAPGGGLVSSLVDAIRHAVLPVICLSYGGVAYVSRFVRTSLLESAGDGAARGARARGRSALGYMTRHGLVQASVPLLTLLGFLIPRLVGGSILVESIFGIPGVGQLLLAAILARDLTVVLALTLVAAVATLVGATLADLLAARLDPRIHRAS
jgi:peptide/nickel transport system permease protein